MLRIILFLFYLLNLSTFVFSQNIIRGKIMDAKTKEPLIGVTILIQNTTVGVASDLEGIFELDSPEKSGTIIISYLSYNSLEITFDVTKSNDLGELKLTEQATALKDVVVVNTKIKNTESALVLETRNAEQIISGISAQQIAKTQDKDASSILKRITGVTINNDRFVNIRGLNERYNTLLINDIFSPSMEVDKRSFSFDVIPANAIERVLIYKTSSADLPGDMAGGTIKIYTKSNPEDTNWIVSLGTQFRTGTTFKNVYDHIGSSTDILGFDASLRSKLKEFANQSVQQSEMNEIGRNLPAFYTVKTKNILPDFKFSIGRNSIFEINNSKLSNITNLSYSNTNRNLQNSFQNRYQGLDDETLYNSWNDQIYNANAQINLMSNFYLMPSMGHSIEWKNFFNQTAKRETIIREGYNNSSADIYYKNYAMRFEQKFIVITSINGKYELNDQFNLNYNVAYNYTANKEPDFRRFSTSKIGNINAPYTIDIPQFSPSLGQASRFNSELDEHVFTANSILEKKIPNEGNFNYQTLKLGFYTEFKTRAFNARWFGYTSPNFSGTILTDPTTSFDFNSNKSLTLTEGTNYDDSYKAQNLLLAGFGNYSINFDKLTLSSGIRLEYNRQMMQSRLRGSGEEVVVDNPLTSILPSINVIFKISPKNNFRVGYSMTTNRPEFRELAPFSYLDFELELSKTGNPALKTSQIHNVDLRYEIYPSNTEIITLGAFYKYFINPIEMVGRSAGNGTSFFYANPRNANNFGFELEVRKQIKNILGNKLQVVANAAFIVSEVDASNLLGQIENRPLQGQAPYVFNTGLFYGADYFNLNLLYNVIGKRIFVVGDKLGNQTIYELPRNVVDIVISKKIKNGIEIKFAINDLLNQKSSFKNNKNLLWKSSQTGTAFNLEATIKL